MKKTQDYDLDIMNVMKHYPINDESGYFFLRIDNENNVFIDCRMESNVLIKALCTVVSKKKNEEMYQSLVNVVAAIYQDMENEEFKNQLRDFFTKLIKI